MILAGVLEGVTVTKMVYKEPWQGPKLTGIQVDNVRYDSRRVNRGDLYIAIRGGMLDGHRFIPDAIRRGAKAVIVEDDSTFPDSFFAHEEVVKIVVPNSRRAMALTSRNLHGDPSRKLRLIGITGTNGKTTTTHLVRSILESSGQRVGFIGTMGHFDGLNALEATHTTPEAPELNEILSSMVMNGCTSGVMEVSSHSLVMDRVFGLRFAAAAFTNLTQDHLDFHGSMKEYFRAKKMLFDSLEEDSVAVTNCDDSSGKQIVSDSHARILGYSTRSAESLVGKDIAVGLEGTTLTVEYQGKDYRISSPLIGSFNVSNILAAMGVCLGLGVPPEAVVEGVASLRAVRGRFESIQFDEGWIAVIDYAHMPDALENTLEVIQALRGHSAGRIITIFGCGGDRDRTKRPIMGAIATKLSDITIVTSDNPRSEDPDTIIDEILGGVVIGPGVHREPDRRKAIAEGLNLARRGDIVLVAGKGHETYQIIGEKKLHLDDREEVLKFLGKQWN